MNQTTLFFILILSLPYPSWGYEQHPQGEPPSEPPNKRQGVQPSIESRLAARGFSGVNYERKLRSSLDYLMNNGLSNGKLGFIWQDGAHKLLDFAEKDAEVREMLKVLLEGEEFSPGWGEKQRQELSEKLKSRELPTEVLLSEMEEMDKGESSSLPYARHLISELKRRQEEHRAEVSLLGSHNGLSPEINLLAVEKMIRSIAERMPERVAEIASAYLINLNSSERAKLRNELSELGGKEAGENARQQGIHPDLVRTLTVASYILENGGTLSVLNKPEGELTKQEREFASSYQNLTSDLKKFADSFVAQWGKRADTAIKYHGSLNKFVVSNGKGGWMLNPNENYRDMEAFRQKYRSALPWALKKAAEGDVQATKLMYLLGDERQEGVRFGVRHGSSRFASNAKLSVGEGEGVQVGSEGAIIQVDNSIRAFQAMAQSVKTKSHLRSVNVESVEILLGSNVDNRTIVSNANGLWETLRNRNTREAAGRELASITKELERPAPLRGTNSSQHGVSMGEVKSANGGSPVTSDKVSGILGKSLDQKLMVWLSLNDPNDRLLGQEIAKAIIQQEQEFREAFGRRSPVRRSVFKERLRDHPQLRKALHSELFKLTR